MTSPIGFLIALAVLASIGVTPARADEDKSGDNYHRDMGQFERDQEAQHPNLNTNNQRAPAQRRAPQQQPWYRSNYR